MEDSEHNELGEESRFARFDLHLELLIQKNHPRIMNLEMKIPEDYPWEEMLQKHFSNPPFTLSQEDYELHLVGKKKITKLRDARKPTTFFSLLRFLEFFRYNLVELERNLRLIESQHEKLKTTANEQVGLRTLLKSSDWGYSSIADKHNIIGRAVERKSRLEDVVKRLENILSRNLNITSRWQYMIEPFYRMVVERINSSFVDNSFNLKTFYPVKTLEETLDPYYSEAMELAIDLNEAVHQTAHMLKQG